MGEGFFGGISLQHHNKNLLKDKKKYNTNKKVIQYSGIQCVSWDETTGGEKAFLAEKNSRVLEDQCEAKKAKMKLKNTLQPTPD